MKEKMLIVGSGGHARSVIDILIQNGDYEIVGCISNDYQKAEFIEGSIKVPIIGNDDMLKILYKDGIKHAFVALGDNYLRKKIYDKLVYIGYTMVNAISRRSYISPTAKIGVGCCVMAGACIGTDAIIGDNCIINTNACIDHDCKIGSSSHIAPGVSISGFVRIGDLSQIGTGGCVIDRITIGNNVFVGAGGAVVKNIEDNVLAVGVPARIIRKRERNE